jgi:hypothetical protein
MPAGEFGVFPHHKQVEFVDPKMFTDSCLRNLAGYDVNKMGFHGF